MSTRAEEKIVRLSVNLTSEASDALKEIASRRKISITEAVRRAIAVLKFLEEARDRGATLHLKEDGETREVVFLG